MSRPTCSVFVLNYNREDLLRLHLPTVVTAASNCTTCDVRVCLVDNASSDGSCRYVRSHMRSVTILERGCNDYLYALNWAARGVDSDYLVLLNNDVSLDDRCLDPLLEPMVCSDVGVFSVTPRLVRPDGVTLDAGRRLGEFRRGFLHHYSDGVTPDVAPTLFPTGGAAAVKRTLFLALGGFDRLYHPAYWEDVDLGYRAWKQGLVNLFQPASHMTHFGSATWSKAPDSERRAMGLRNAWLFTWRNVDDGGILMRNVLWTVRYYVGAIRHRDEVLAVALRDGIRRLPSALNGRKVRSGKSLLTDREVCRFAGRTSYGGSAE